MVVFTAEIRRLRTLAQDGPLMVVEVVVRFSVEVEVNISRDNPQLLSAVDTFAQPGLLNVGLGEPDVRVRRSD